MRRGVLQHRVLRRIAVVMRPAVIRFPRALATVMPVSRPDRTRSIITAGRIGSLIRVRLDGPYPVESD